MEQTSTPHITSAFLDSYMGHSVMVVKKVMQLWGKTAVIDFKGNITTHLNQVFLLPSSPLGSLPSGTISWQCTDVYYKDTYSKDAELFGSQATEQNRDVYYKDAELFGSQGTADTLIGLHPWHLREGGETKKSYQCAQLV